MTSRNRDYSSRWDSGGAGVHEIRLASPGLVLVAALAA
jgi:hypothetical protein